MSEAFPRPNEGDERKLWFEYIKTLNERRLQTSQRSGISAYVLIATLIGLLYRFGPRIPDFISQRDETKAGITIFVLLTIVLGSFLMAVTAFEMFVAGDAEFRATPKSSEAFVPVVYGIVAFAGAVFICVEGWVAITIARHTKFTKYLLLTHAFWLALNTIYPIVRYRQLANKAKDVRNPVPKFSPLRLPRVAHLPSSAFVFVWSVLGAISLVRYLNTLPSHGLRPFKAASVTLIVTAIVAYMVLRSIGNASQQQYFGLERDIVLNRMTAAEIRERYLRDLSGPDMAQWLDEAFVALDRKEEQLQQEFDSAQNKLKEISDISVEYQAERRQRVGVVVGKVRKSLEGCLSQYDVLTLQADFFANTYKTQEENEALRKRFKLLSEKYRAFKEYVEKVLKLLDELAKLMG